MQIDSLLLHPVRLLQALLCIHKQILFPPSRVHLELERSFYPVPLLSYRASINSFHCLNVLTFLKLGTCTVCRWNEGPLLLVESFRNRPTSPRSHAEAPWHCPDRPVVVLPFVQFTSLTSHTLAQQYSKFLERSERLIAQVEGCPRMGSSH